MFSNIYLPKLTPSSTTSTIVVERFTTLAITSKISADYKDRCKVMHTEERGWKPVDKYFFTMLTSYSTAKTYQFIGGTDKLREPNIVLQGCYDWYKLSRKTRTLVAYHIKHQENMKTSCFTLVPSGQNLGF